MRKIVLVVLFLGAAAALLPESAYSLRREPAARVALDRSTREARRDAEWKIAEIFEKAAVRPGARIADIGSGDGFLTLPLAERVGRDGRVFAVDIDERALGQLRTRIREGGLANVEVIRGSETDPRLAAALLDGVIILRAYHEFHSYRDMLAKIRAAMKPGGRLVIADVGPGPEAGSREEQVRRHVLASGLAERELAEAGFRVLETSDPFAELGNGERVWLIVAQPNQAAAN